MAIDRCSLSQLESDNLKEELIYEDSTQRDETFLKMILDGKLELVDEFIRWCLHSEEEIADLKRTLFFSESFKVLIFGLKSSQIRSFLRLDKYIIMPDLEHLNHIFKWSCASEEEVSDYKKGLSCTDDALYYLKRSILLNEWEKVDTFLSWCCSSQEELKHFKKNCLLKKEGSEILISLIEANKEQQAENFLAWSELTTDKVNELKRRTLFYEDRALKLFTILMVSEKYKQNEKALPFRSRQEAIEMFYRWFLTEKETVLEFKDHFNTKWKRSKTYEGKRKVGFDEFDLAIEQRLIDIDEKQTVMRS